jgi:hypothetical protein
LHNLFSLIFSFSLLFGLLQEALLGDGSAATKIEVVQTAPDSAKQALLGSSAGNTTMLKLLDQVGLILRLPAIN